MSKLLSPAAQAKLEKRRRFYERQVAEDLRAVLSLAQGRRMVWHLLDERCRTFGGSFTGDPQWTALNEGRRAVGIELMQAAQEHAPDLYLQMLTEAVRAREEESLHRKAVTAQTENDE